MKEKAKNICSWALKNKYSIGVIGVMGLALSAVGVRADVPTASDTLDSIMTVIINTTVGLATTIFTKYWPYVLVFGIIAGLVGVFARFLHLGGKK